MGDLIPDCVYEGIWFYKGRNGEGFFNLVGTEIEPTKLAQEKGIAPKKRFLVVPVGWLLTVQREEGETIFTAESRTGEEGMINKIYVLNKGKGGVEGLARPGSGRTLEVLKAEEIVFVPVLPMKERGREREGGVLVLAAKDLLVPQNVLRVTGFLK